jgi:hypothetical protein
MWKLNRRDFGKVIAVLPLMGRSRATGATGPGSTEAWEVSDACFGPDVFRVVQGDPATIEATLRDSSGEECLGYGATLVGLTARIGPQTFPTSFLVDDGPVAWSDPRSSRFWIDIDGTRTAELSPGDYAVVVQQPVEARWMPVYACRLTVDRRVL